MIHFKYLISLFVTITFIIPLQMNAQENGRINIEIQEILKVRSDIPEFKLFKNVADPRATLSTNAIPATYWNYDEKVFRLMQLNPSDLIKISLSDHEGKPLSMILQRQFLHDGNAKLLNSANAAASTLEHGLHYRGIIEELPGSVAAISFFEDQSIGVIAIPEIGNLVIGKLRNENNLYPPDLPHALYYEHALGRKPDFQCGTNDLPVISELMQGLPAPDSIYTNRCKTTKIFLECDYKLYQDHNRQINQVKNFITGLFNVVKAIYYNEYVNIEIADIMVWTTQDPFLHTDLSSIIYHYASYRRNNFSGNLAQLISTFQPQQQGGIAFLGTLCQPYNGQSGPHSFAYIYNSYSQLPTYSWSVFVMSHELGHNFGSPHTHACFWGPNRNQTLDNCQPPEGNACAAGPPATGGGTIMSYCHLAGGINFSKGFGKEPGDLIRNNVQAASCLSFRFVPVISANIGGPYFEGDSLVLKAIPSQPGLEYDWFHYDYLMPQAKDSVFKPTYSGIYKVAISDRCTEYSASDTIVLNDFIVNLGCPVIKGKRDSVQMSVTRSIKQLGTMRDTLKIPDSLFAKVPANAKDVLVELQTKITSLGNSWTRDVNMAYQGPAGTGIANNKYAPNATEPPGANTEKTYSRILGRFNPKGNWYFTTNYVRFVANIDSKVQYAIVISWRFQDSVESCSIPLCDGKSRGFDAGIPNAKYSWSSGQISRIINTNKVGNLSVMVTKGSKKASHTIQLYHYNTTYDQSHTICEGNTVQIGNHYYNKSGIYIDSLLSFNLCDSIITSTIEVIPLQRFRDTTILCYGETFMGDIFYNDSLITTIYNGVKCDSMIEKQILVYPQINSEINQTDVLCYGENTGSINVNVVTGVPPYAYSWSNGSSTHDLNGISAGRYQLTITDANNCMALLEFEITQPEVLQVELITQNTNTNDGRAEAIVNGGTAPYKYLWSTGDTTNSIEALIAGDYTLTVTDANLCDTIIHFTLQEIVGNDDTDNTRLINLYPNPSGDELYINISAEFYTGKTVECQFFDLHSRLVSTRQLSPNKTTHLLNLESLVPGVYFVVLQNIHKDLIRTKLLKQ